MSEKSFPFFNGQGSTVTQDDWEAMACTWQDNGVYGHPGDTHLSIVPGPSQDTIQVNAGDAAISGYHYSLTAASTLTCVPNAGGTPRTDLVVLQLDRVNSLITPVLLTGTDMTGVPVDAIPLGIWSQLPSSQVTAENWGSATDRRWFLGTRLVAAIPGADPPARPGAFLYHPGDALGDRAPVYIGDVDSGGNPFWREWRPWIRDVQLDGPVQASSPVDIDSNSSTYEPGTTPLSATFVAPPSGQVYVTVYAQVEGTDPSSGYVSYEIRQDNVSGAVVVAASDDKSAEGQEHAHQGSTYRGLETGLTPGATYFIRCMVRTSNATNAAHVFSRSLLVEPVLIDGPSSADGGPELYSGPVAPSSPRIGDVWVQY